MLRRHRVEEDTEGEGTQPDIKADVSDAKSAELSPASAAPAPETSTQQSERSRKSLVRDESLKRITSAPVPFGSLAEALAYVIFLVVFVLATTVVDESPQGFYFANRLKTALVDQAFTAPAVLSASSTTTDGDGSTAQPVMSFTGIRDQAQFWAFLLGPFADVVYGSMATSVDVEPSNEADSVLASSNRLLGGVRLRTLRVKAGSCPALAQIPEYESVVPFCYGQFTAAVEETSGYGSIVNSESIVATVSYTTARAFFDALETKTYTDLATCGSDCERVCGEHFGVDQFRYATSCSAHCGVHCKCIYEEPAGLRLCDDPNPNGEAGVVPTAIYAYNWSNSDVTEAQAVRGYTGASFPGSGYVVELGRNATAARERLATLQADRFLDLPTRALVLDFTVYNAYLQLFDVVQLVAEFPASGGAFVQISDVVLRLFRYSSASVTRVALEGCLALFVLVQWQRLLVAVYRAGGVTRYLSATPWHVLTALHLVVFAGAIGVRLWLVDLVYGSLSGQADQAVTSATLEQSPKLQHLATMLYVESAISSVNAALVWLKLLQYTTVSKRMSVLLRMLARAARDLAWFFICFLVCVCGFAQVGLLLFGLDVRGFSSLGDAILTLLQAVAGDLDYGRLAESHRVAGPLFYLAYYLLLLLVLVNVFLAILNDAYMQTITEQEEADHELETGGPGRVLGWDASGDVVDAEKAVLTPDEELALDKARRDVDQLHKYPFSKGLWTALRLVIADVKRAMSELRAGKKAASVSKVDPLLSLTAPAQQERENWPRASATASRKLTRHVKRQVASELLEAESQLRVSHRVEQQQSQLENLRRTVDEDVAERLEALAESNRLKTRRMNELDKTLGAIEKLCAQLVSDTACLRVDSDDEGDVKLPGSRSGSVASSSSARPSIVSGGRRTSSPGNKQRSLSSAILSNRQREMIASKAKAVAGDIEEINL